MVITVNMVCIYNKYGNYSEYLITVNMVITMTIAITVNIVIQQKTKNWISRPIIS